MAKYNILIVDDQRAVRSVLRAAIESLGSQFMVADVPSGEEAQLELSMKKFDLLVLDVRLPGISGLELLQRTRQRNPELRVILITGSVDPKVRRDVADANADAFFLKPIETADFLDAVERALGIVEQAAAIDYEAELAGEVSAESVSERLTALRQELDAISTVLLDDRGRPLARAGDLPDASAEGNLFPALMSAFSAAERIAHFLGKNPPNDLAYYPGTKYDLFLAHVGNAYALLVILNPLHLQADISTLLEKIYRGLGDLLKILTQMGVSMVAESPETPYQGKPEEELAEFDAGLEPELEALFNTAPARVLGEADVDAFWDKLADDDASNGITSADALTYEQARQLGLAPEEDE
ncbi:MAG: response regulator [Anaerolineales bacterium]|nr:response regulator [Anaerolineales bacterium]